MHTPHHTVHSAVVSCYIILSCNTCLGQSNTMEHTIKDLLNESHWGDRASWMNIHIPTLPPPDRSWLWRVPVQLRSQPSIIQIPCQREQPKHSWNCNGSLCHPFSCTIINIDLILSVTRFSVLCRAGEINFVLICNRLLSVQPAINAQCAGT